LAGVGCEACHGPAGDHARNANDESLRPPVNISAEVCGQCHVGEHHPNFEEWSQSGHAGIDEHVAESLLEGGSSVNACGSCHSGTVPYLAVIDTKPVSPTIFANQSAEQLLGIQCVNCHDPLQRTGNAVEPEDGRDYQLRWPEVAEPFPTN